jgi:hypothetical protein
MIATRRRCCSTTRSCWFLVRARTALMLAGAAECGKENFTHKTPSCCAEAGKIYVLYISAGRCPYRPSVTS